MESTPSVGKDLQSLTTTQQQELQGVLKNPLTGRHVMIPITSKAFVVGSLKPTINSEGEEVVLVRNQDSSKLKETPRKEVYTYLQEERQKKVDESKKNNAKPVKNETKKKEPVSIPKNEEITSIPILPYFDIKEELDDSGNVVRSQAIDVTKQLELVTKHAGDATANREDFKEEPMDFPTSHDGNNDHEDVEFQEEISVETNQPRIQPISDQEYQSLSDRLEELARLEEEAEEKSHQNALSALKLQSKGWSKGFLGGKQKPKKPSKPQTEKSIVETSDNTTMTTQTTPRPTPPSPTTTAAPPQSTAIEFSPETPTSEAKEQSEFQATQSNTTEQPPETTTPEAKQQPKTQEKPLKPSTGSKKGWSKGFLNSAQSAKEKTGPIEPKNTVDGGSKKVSFQANVAEVREIPRIGKTSVSSLKPPASPSLENPVPARPFDASVFSGIVKERPIRPLIPGSKAGLSEDGKPKKKLSKFAQERLQNS